MLICWQILSDVIIVLCWVRLVKYLWNLQRDSKERRGNARRTAEYSPRQRHGCLGILKHDTGSNPVVLAQ